jgi:hypothetical protein
MPIVVRIEITALRNRNNWMVISPRRVFRFKFNPGLKVCSSRMGMGSADSLWAMSTPSVRWLVYLLAFVIRG